MYVDDIIVVSSSTAATDRLIHQLRDAFAVKDLWPLHFFLGLEVTRSASGVLLTQKKYALDFLRRAGLLKCKPVDTPRHLQRSSQPSMVTCCLLMKLPDFGVL